MANGRSQRAKRQDKIMTNAKIARELFHIAKELEVEETKSKKFSDAKKKVKAILDSWMDEQYGVQLYLEGIIDVLDDLALETKGSSIDQDEVDVQMKHLKGEIWSTVFSEHGVKGTAKFVENIGHEIAVISMELGV